MLQGRIRYDLDDDVEIRLALTQYCTRNVFKYCGLKSYLSQCHPFSALGGLMIQKWKIMEFRSSDLALEYAIL